MPESRIKIGVMQENEAKQVHLIHTRLQDIKEPLQLPFEHFKKTLEKPENLILVARDTKEQNIIVGYRVITIKKDGTLNLGMIGVHPTYQGHGIGKKIDKLIEKLALHLQPKKEKITLQKTTSTTIGELHAEKTGYKKTTEPDASQEPETVFEKEITRKNTPNPTPEEEQILKQATQQLEQIQE